MVQIMETINAVPPVTRYMMGAILLLGAFARMKVVSHEEKFAFVASKLISEPWRPLTSVLYNGKLDIALITQLHSILMFSRTLEEVGYTTSKKYLRSLLLLGVVLLIASPMLGILFPGPAFFGALSYIWSRKIPQQRLVLLVFLELPANYLFWYQLLLSCITSNLNSDATGVLTFILGVIAGHTVFFTEMTVPLLTGKQLL